MSGVCTNNAIEGCCGFAGGRTCLVAHPPRSSCDWCTQPSTTSQQISTNNKYQQTANINKRLLGHPPRHIGLTSWMEWQNWASKGCWSSVRPDKHSSDLHWGNALPLIDSDVNNSNNNQKKKMTDLLSILLFTGAVVLPISWVLVCLAASQWIAEKWRLNRFSSSQHRNHDFCRHHQSLRK